MAAVIQAKPYRDLVFCVVSTLWIWQDVQRCVGAIFHVVCVWNNCMYNAFVICSDLVWLFCLFLKLIILVFGWQWFIHVHVGGNGNSTCNCNHSGNVDASCKHNCIKRTKSFIGTLFTCATIENKHKTNDGQKRKGCHKGFERQPCESSTASELCGRVRFLLNHDDIFPVRHK